MLKNLCIFLSLLGLASLATATFGNSYETVSRFTFFCNAGVQCHGFDIVLKNVSCASVTDTFDLSRYRAPTKIQNSTTSTCVIRYKSAYNSTTKRFSESTRVPSKPSTSQLSCYVGGMAGATYNASGCEQFGYSLKGSETPSSVDYYWLVASNVTVGSLVRSASNVAIPAVTWSVQSVAGGNPVAKSSIKSLDLKNDTDSCRRFEDAQCVKILTTKIETEIELDDLVDDNPTIYNKTKIQVKWKILQSKPTCNSTDDDDDNEDSDYLEDEDEYEDDTVSVVRVYEFYNYTGAYRPVNHRALDKCSNETSSTSNLRKTPSVSTVGYYRGSQMAALVSGAATRNPTKKPVRKPTGRPTKKPVRKPTRLPTKKPVRKPTRLPTRHPTKKPVRKPTRRPTKKQLPKPTRRPTNRPQKATRKPTRSLFATYAIGSIRNSVFYTSPDQPIQASLSVFSNSSIQFYSSCDNLRQDLINSVSIKVNQIILDYSKINPIITDSENPVGKENPIVATTPTSSSENTASGENSYGTNNQVAGVDQADIVKSTATHSFGAYGDKLIVWDVVKGKQLSVTVMPTPDRNPSLSTTPPFVKRNSMVVINGRPGFGFQRVSISGLLMEGSRLTVIVTGYEYFFGPFFYDGNISKSRILNNYASTSIRIYDISNIPTDGSELPLVASQHLDGNFQDARSVNNTAYIVTMSDVNTYPLLYSNLDRYQFNHSLNSSQYIEAATKLAVEKYIPEFVDQLIDEILNLNGQCQGVTKLAMFRTATDDSTNSSSVPSLDSFMDGVANIFTVDMLQTPPLTTSNSTTNITFYTTRSFIPNSYTSTIYASTEKIVLSAVGYNYYPPLASWQENTFLMAFEMTKDKTNVQGIGIATIPGYLINSYAMDIWDNHLRVASTRRAQWGCDETKYITVDGISYTFCNWVLMADSDNMISVLQLPTSENMGMKLVGYIDGLGDVGESIYAVRFMENRGFMSTFFQRDPLYALDLSNHVSPKVAGYLKVPGFSSYLHPYNSEGSILIAVGQGADDNGVTTGLQITLFNVTDLKLPSVIHTYEIKKNPNVYSSSDASYDPESFRFLDQSKKLILPVTIWNYTSYDNLSNFDGFYIFDVSPVSGIKKSFEVNHVLRFSGCWYNAYFSSRSLVHNGILTTIKGHTILAHDLVNASKRWSLNLDTNNTECGGYWVY